MLSFGDRALRGRASRQAGVPLICQVQTMAHAREAVAAGAAVIVAQGGEAGGHGGSRAHASRWCRRSPTIWRSAAPDTLLVAAGGIADGRGLAAALMLGADGVPDRLAAGASRECLVPPGFHAAIVAADGDATVKTTVIDVVRNFHWPSEFTGRVAADATSSWNGMAARRRWRKPRPGRAESERYWQAFHSGDCDQHRRLRRRGRGPDTRRPAGRPHRRSAWSSRPSACWPPAQASSSVPAR